MRVMTRLLPLLLLCAALVAGCVDSEGGGATNTPTGSPSPTTTSTPDPTTSPQATATVEPGTPTPTAEAVTPTPTATPTAQLSTPSPTAVAPLTLRLGIGQSGDAGGGWVLRLEAVENDSRCGVDVVCVWAGEATVVLTATSPTGEVSEVRIVLSPGEGAAMVDGLTLRGYDLTPEPRADRPIDPATYSVSIDVAGR